MEADNELSELTDRDKVAFVKSLQDEPAPPNDKLREAADRYAHMSPERRAEYDEMRRRYPDLGPMPNFMPLTEAYLAGLKKRPCSSVAEHSLAMRKVESSSLSEGPKVLPE